MERSLGSIARRGYYPVVLAASLALVGIVWQVLGPTTAVRGTYAIFGLTLGALVYYGARLGRDSGDGRSVGSRHLKAIVLVSLVGGSLVTLFDTRVLGLLLILPVGYALLFAGMRSGATTLHTLIGAVVLFGYEALSKYATTGFYFSGGDSLISVRYVRGLLETGSTTAIKSLYQFFPGSHFQGGSVSLLTDLPAYDSMILACILLYAGLIPLVYLLSTLVLGRQQVAVSVAVAFSLLEPSHHFATYFFAESFAVPLLVFGLFTVLRDRSTVTGRSGVLLLLFVSAAVLTHHMTVLLVVPLLVWLVAVAAVNPRERIQSRPIVYLLGSLLVLAIGHWAFTGWAWWFIVALGTALANLPNLLAIPGASGAGGSTLTFGVRILTQDLVDLLTYPPYIYVTLLTAVFSLGMVRMVRNSRQSLGAASFLTGGLLSSVLLFDIPIPIPAASRVALPYAVLFAFVLGLGLEELRLRRPDFPLGVVLVSLLFVGLATSSAITAADDVNKLSDNPQMQTSFSETEYGGIIDASSFVEERGGDTTALWATRLAFQLEGVTTTGQVRISERGIHADPGLFVYRNRWPGHKVSFRQSGYSLQSFMISESHLKGIIGRENKVYDTEEVGLLWHRRAGLLGD